jgi:hypothetical protein
VFRSKPFAKKLGPRASPTQPFSSAPSTYGRAFDTQRSAVCLPELKSALIVARSVLSTCLLTVTEIPYFSLNFCAIAFTSAGICVV